MASLEQLWIEREERFLLPTHQVSRTLGTLREHLEMDVHNAARPASYNWTTYLDTSDHQLGSGRRLRIRHYASGVTEFGIPVSEPIAFLEYKQRRQGFRRKVRVAMRSDVLIRSLGAGRFHCSELKELADLADLAQCEVLSRAIECGVAPQFLAFYRRSALRGEAGRVRVTVDERVRFCRSSDVGWAISSGRPTSVIGVSEPLLEAKWIGDKPGWLGTLLGSLAPTGRGKYERGYAALLNNQAMPARRERARSVA